MMAIITPEEWRPRGIDDLEPAAWRALRYPGSACVVAGPGAGKTEFLAQRASYLLETALCPAPFRILAISFKSDAAENLSTRVRKRCPPDLASRFTSITFDSFTKSLVDRFQATIPAEWRPTRPYDVIFPLRRDIGPFIERAQQVAPPQWQGAVRAIDAGTFESHMVGACRLIVPRTAAQSAEAFAIQEWWGEQLGRRPNSGLSFVSLNRLAELLIRTNPQIRRALQQTYRYVFVDEFQDTSYAQYDFLLSAFQGAGTIVTGVGDDKQRIMTWAGARPDAFERFAIDFDAAQIPLLFNFRSSPDLVRIQHVVARALDPTVPQALAQTNRQVEGEVAQVWNSRTMNEEVSHLARWLRYDMATRDKSPRDYAILVKQLSDNYERELTPLFTQAGLRLRNESHALGRTTLQDLLSDSFANLALDLFRLGAARRAPSSWQRASSALMALRATAPGDEQGEARVEAELSHFVEGLRSDMSRYLPSQGNAAAFTDRVVAYLGHAAIQRTYIEYGSNDLLEIMEHAFRLHMDASSGGQSWSDCLDAFEGVGQIPLMTVHKSKGLEYDTIVFVGLDDQAWWAHRPGSREGLATFFVALSRAKQRAVFSFCQQRGQRQRVAELFRLLTEAGVPEISIGGLAALI